MTHNQLHHALKLSAQARKEITMMTRLRRVLASLVLALAFLSGSAADSFAGQKKTVHVKEYTKKDGTTVKAHDRAAPKSKAEKKPEEKPEEKASTKQPLPQSPSSSSSTVKRDATGRIERSEVSKHQFEVQSGYPKGRSGYVVDHVRPLACGGADTPANMQWQTVAEAKAKDKWERVDCR